MRRESILYALGGKNQTSEGLGYGLESVSNRTEHTFHRATAVFVGFIPPHTTHTRDMCWPLADPVKGARIGEALCVLPRGDS